MWKPTKFDAPESQMFGNSSDKDRAFWEGMAALSETYPHSLKHVLTHWPAYTKRISLMRFLAHYELFKMTTDLPGSIVELGVSRGTSFFTWHKLLETFAPMDTQTKVYGFDSFEGLTDFAEADGTGGDRDEVAGKKVGGWSAGDVEGEIFGLCALVNADNVLARERSRLIKGRVQDTLDPFLAETPGLRIRLLHLDMDLYEPTKFALDRLYDLVVPGGLIVMDEYALPPWAGESTAWEETARSRGVDLRVQKFPWAFLPGGYVIKPGA